MYFASRSLLFLSMAGLLLPAGACDDGTSPAAPGTVSFSVATARTGAASVSTGPARVEVQSDGSHTLELTRVAVVIKKIELSSADGPEGVGAARSEGDRDGREELELGPVLVEVPLDGGVDRVFSATLPEGRYGEIELEIHKPSRGDGSDSSFVRAHPEFDGVSIRVEGRFDGVAFVFTQDLDAEQEYELDPPLEVGPGSSGTNLTLRIDLASWFVRPDGSLVSPATAGPGGAGYEVVKENIKRSFRAFEDHDHDGEHDDD